MFSSNDWCDGYCLIVPIQVNSNCPRRHSCTLLDITWEYLQTDWIGKWIYCGNLHALHGLQETSWTIGTCQLCCLLVFCLYYYPSVVINTVLLHIWFKKISDQVIKHISRYMFHLWIWTDELSTHLLTTSSMIYLV